MLISKLDTNNSVGKEDWKDTLSAEMLKTTLIHCTGRSFTAKDFADKAISTNEYKTYRLSPGQMFKVLVTKFADVVVLEQHPCGMLQRGILNSLNFFRNMKREHLLSHRTG